MRNLSIKRDNISWSTPYGGDSSTPKHRYQDICTSISGYMHPWTQLSGYMHPWTQICTLRSFANGQLKSGNYVNEDLLMVTLSRETASGCSYFDDIWLDSWIVRKLVGKSFGSWLHLTENMIRSRPSPKVINCSGENSRYFHWESQTVQKSRGTFNSSLQASRRG